MVRWAKQWRPSITCTTPRLTRSAGERFSMRSPRSSMEPLVTSPRSPLSRLEMARSVVVLPAPLPPKDGDDAAFGHLQRHALEHQDHVVVDDLDAVDVENNVFASMVLFRCDPMKGLRQGFRFGGSHVTAFQNWRAHLSPGPPWNGLCPATVSSPSESQRKCERRGRRAAPQGCPQDWQSAGVAAGQLLVGWYLSAAALTMGLRICSSAGTSRHP